MMADAEHQELSFEEFTGVLAEELAVAQDRLTPTARFIQDLQVDSLALASMMLRLEEMGVHIPLEKAWEIQTIGDAYQAYQDTLGAGQ
jgi:acyl carrier protein